MIMMMTGWLCVGDGDALWAPVPEGAQFRQLNDKVDYNTERAGKHNGS